VEICFIFPKRSILGPNIIFGILLKSPFWGTYFPKVAFFNLAFLNTQKSPLESGKDRLHYIAVLFLLFYFSDYYPIFATKRNVSYEDIDSTHRGIALNHYD